MALSPQETIKDNREVVAVFDFDGTLTRGDSFLPFIRSCVGPVRFLTGIVANSPTLFGYLLKIVPNWKAKEAVTTHFFREWTCDQLEAAGKSFAGVGLPELLRPVALDRLHWHLQEGHRVILVSASLEVYLKPWAKTIGIHDVLATRLESIQERLTGRLEGENCYGPEKLRRVREYLMDRSKYRIYAYGDSRGDRELLDDADMGFFKRFSSEEI